MTSLSLLPSHCNQVVERDSPFGAASKKRGEASTPLFSHGSFPKGLPCSWQHTKDPGAADQSACLWSLHLDLRATLLPHQPILPTGNEKKKKLYKIFLQLSFCSSRVGAMWCVCLLVSSVSFWQQGRFLGHSTVRECQESAAESAIRLIDDTGIPQTGKLSLMTQPCFHNWKNNGIWFKHKSAVQLQRVSTCLNSEGDTFIMELQGSQLYENMAPGSAIIFIIHVAWPIFSPLLESTWECICTCVRVQACEREDVGKLMFFK